MSFVQQPSVHQQPPVVPPGEFVMVFPPGGGSLPAVPCAASSSPAQQTTVKSPPSALAELKRTAISVARSSQPAKGRNAKDGKIYSKMYNSMAARPFAPIGKLTQQIDMTMEISLGALTTSTVANTYGSYLCQLGTFAGATAWLTVFDQYRIDQIECWLDPIAAQGTTVFGSLFTAVDLDDANGPTSLGEVGDKPGALVGSGGAGRYHKWKPHVAVACFSGTFTSYKNEPAGWIDSASPNVQHYGFKIAADVTPVAVSYKLSVRVKVSFRGPIA